MVLLRGEPSQVTVSSSPTFDWSSLREDSLPWEREVVVGHGEARRSSPDVAPFRLTGEQETPPSVRRPNTECERDTFHSWFTLRFFWDSAKEVPVQY